MSPILQKQNVREQSHQLTLQLINFELLLQHSELRSLEHEMLRLKITSLTILHSNTKIQYLIRQNKQHQSLHSHIIGSLRKIVVEGLLYLLKINYLLMKKIANYEQSIMKDLKKLLEADKNELIKVFHKQALLFN